MGPNLAGFRRAQLRVRSPAAEAGVRTIESGADLTTNGRSEEQLLGQAPDEGEPEQEGAAMRTRKVPKLVQIPRSEELRVGLRSLSGSDDEDFSETLLHQVTDTLWQANSYSDEHTRQVGAAIAAMMGMKPRDELEGMLIGQLIASHNAAMECYRRSMISTQGFEAWRENLNQANKLSRTYAALTEALDRHRGKGQQRITVEHVNVHAGGQAIVGAITPGGGSSQKLEEQTCVPREITHEPSTPMRSPDPGQETVPVARGAGKAPV